MFRYTTLYINAISLFISIIIFSFGTFLNSNINSISEAPKIEKQIEQKLESNLEKQEENLKYTEENEHLDSSTQVSKEKNNVEIQSEDFLWYLEIPSINLKAKINEGTTKEIMDEYIGHFEETSKFDGNVGLAAHNRGYKNNYFENLKKLKKEDEIFYYYNGQNKKYRVISNSIIEDTDWSIFEQTQDNIITLVTCVENEPTYRRCVQAIEEV